MDEHQIRILTYRLADHRLPAGVKPFRSDRTINRANELLERFFPIYVILVIILGLTFHRSAEALAGCTVFLLGIQMFLMGLSVRIRAVLQSLQQPRFMLFWIFLAWGVMPAVSFLLGRLFLSSSPEFAVGMILTTALPAAITSNVWTGISAGNLPLNITIVGTASVLSGIVTPFLLSAWVGAFISIDALDLFLGFLTGVMLPTLAGIFVNEKASFRLDSFRTVQKLVVKILAGLIIFINAGVMEPYLRQWGWQAVGLLFLVILQAVLTYALVLLIMSRVKGVSREDLVPLAYASAMRNNSAGVVIGFTYFGPTVAAPVILSILMQQPLASLIHRFIFSPTHGFYKYKTVPSRAD